MKKNARKITRTPAVPPIAKRVSALEHGVIVHTSKITKLEDLYVLIAQKVDNIADAVRYGNDCNEKIVAELRGSRDDIAGLSTLVKGISCVANCEQGRKV